MTTPMPAMLSLRYAVAIVAMANLSYFFIEFGVAERIGSVSLFADSVDFLEDTAVNFLIFVALGWSVRKRILVGMFMAVLLLVPTAALLWTAWQKFNAPMPPDPALLSLTGAGAMIVNIGCALLLARFRHHNGSLTKAAFLSARNDAIANVAIIAAGVVTVFWSSGWPDLIVGIGIAIMNIDAALEVWEAARKERAVAEA
ncbi:MAG TPA: cation transporter [Rhodocyclaceae bacterium]|nr:cation transporter [Rhodocyclaceae bacterium]